jgi:hypothetical protein
MAVVELLGSTRDGGGLLLGRRSQVRTLFGLSAGEGFGCLWSSPMQAWRLPMAVGDLGRPGAQVRTLSRGLSAAEVRWWAGQCRWGLAAAAGDFHPSVPFVDLGSSGRCRCSCVMGMMLPLPCRWSLVG